MHNHGFARHPIRNVALAAAGITGILGGWCWYSSREAALEAVHNAAPIVLDLLPDANHEAQPVTARTVQPPEALTNGGPLANADLPLAPSRREYARPRISSDAISNSAAPSQANPYSEFAAALFALAQGNHSTADEALMALVQGQLPVPLDEKRLKAGLGISTDIVDAALKDMATELAPTDRANVIATTFLAYQTMKAFSVAQSLYGVRDLAGFNALLPEQRTAISQQLAGWTWMDHMNFGEAVMQPMGSFIRGVVQSPNAMNNWQSRVLPTSGQRR